MLIASWHMDILQIRTQARAGVLTRAWNWRHIEGFTSQECPLEVTSEQFLTHGLKDSETVLRFSQPAHLKKGYNMRRMTYRQIKDTTFLILQGRCGLRQSTNMGCCLEHRSALLLSPMYMAGISIHVNFDICKWYSWKSFQRSHVRTLLGITRIGISAVVGAGSAPKVLTVEESDSPGSNGSKMCGPL